MSNRLVGLSLLVLAAGCSSAEELAAPPPETISALRLGTSGAAAAVAIAGFRQALAINDRSDVLVELNGQISLRRANGRVVPLAPLSGYIQGYAQHINYGGAAAGYSYRLDANNQPEAKATVWIDGRPREVAIPVINALGVASDLNDKRQVVGYYYEGSLQTADLRPFGWTETGGYVAFEVPVGGWGYAVTISDAGTAFGYTNLGATTWDPSGKMTTLTGFPTGFGGNRITRTGYFVGSYWDGTTSRAASWHPTKGLRIAEVIPGTTPTQSFAYDGNARGELVGYQFEPASGSTPATFRGFFFDGEHTVELVGLGGTQTLPLSINRCGAVAGYSTDGSNQFQAVQWGSCR